MGGGDLNLKKSWHPSTLRNQEKVWKAEKQKAHEDKKIAELQRELREEREREALIEIGEKAGTMKAENKELNWMYKGPNSHVSREEYLLGRKIDKTFEMLQKEEAAPKEKQEETSSNKPAYTIEHEINPEQVIQKDESNIQVDMKRKLLEDPLLMIRQKEESTKRSITSNPVKMKQLEMLIKSLKKNRKKKKHKKVEGYKEKKSKKSRKHKKKEKSKKKKKKHSKKESSTGEDSDSSSQSDSESLEAARRRLVKEMIDRETKREFLLRNSTTELARKESHAGRDSKTCKSPDDLQNNKNHNTQKYSRDSGEDRNQNSKSVSKNDHEAKSRESRKSLMNLEKEKDRESREQNSSAREKKRKSGSRSRSREKIQSKSSNTKIDVSKSDDRKKRDKETFSKKDSELRSAFKNHHSRSRSRSRDRDRDKDKDREKRKLTERKGSEDREEVMKRKREEMIAAAAVRDSERKRNVEKYKEEKEREEKELKDSQQLTSNLGGSSVGSSVESRIRSKVGFSQRKPDHMDSNFLRK